MEESKRWPPVMASEAKMWDKTVGAMTDVIHKGPRGPSKMLAGRMMATMALLVTVQGFVVTPNAVTFLRSTSLIAGMSKMKAVFLRM